MKLVLAGLFCLALLTPQLFSAPPNIVFIMTDDQGEWASGHAGHPQAHTPNLDRLAREGARLTNCFTVTPVCSPSRAALIASRYGSELGIVDWINSRVDPDVGLAPTTITWPEVLQAAGYRTGLIGKWHLGEEPKYHPTNAGYAYFMGFQGGGNKPRNPKLEVGGKIQVVEGFVVELVTDDALRFIAREQAGPFLLSVHYREPHMQYAPVPEADGQRFRDIDPVLPQPQHPKLDVANAKRQTAAYLASIAAIDRNVGRLLEQLDQLGLTENTVVIFTSDHGYNIGHHGIWHKGNGTWLLNELPPAVGDIPSNRRPNMFDTSLRVPALVRWPGTVRPGSVVERTISFLDWYPTLVAIAGAELPANESIRGRNFLPLLRGENIAWDDDLYAEYNMRHDVKTQMRVYRTPQWKLMRDFLNPGRDELYDLTSDPSETRNLIDNEDTRTVKARQDLSEKMLARMRTLRDPALADAKELLLDTSQ